jgi:hypothetical protein
MNPLQTLLGRGFTYDCEIRQPDGEVIRFREHNLLPQVGINHAAGLLLGTTAPISAWYVGLFEGNYVPDASVTAAQLTSLVGECTAYSEAARPLWAGVYDGVSSVDNLASKATFTLTADKLIYGAFLVSSSTKGGTSGVLLSIARYSTPQDLKSGAVFSVGVGSILAAGA